MDPTKRITSDQALQDAYFHEEPFPSLEFVSSVNIVFIRYIESVSHGFVILGPCCWLCVGC